MHALPTWLRCSTLALLLLAGCDCGRPPTHACAANAECGSGEICVDRMCMPHVPDDAPPPRIDAPTSDAPAAVVAIGVEVEPAMISLVVAPGETRTQTLAVRLRMSDGTTQPATATEVELNELAIGRVEVGSFTTYGRAGGMGLIRVAVDELGTSVPVEVRVESVHFGAGLTETATAPFAGTMGAATSDIVYPLEGAVLPQNAFPTDVQWLSGAAGDVFRVTLSKPHARVTAYLPEDGARHFLPSQDAWRALVRTDPTSDLTIDVVRAESSGTLTPSTPVHIHFASAAITGSVYYWDIEAGRIMRVDDGTNSRVNFMPTPPRGIYDGDCVGCHTVSPSGRYMAGRLDGGDNIGAIFDLTADLTGATPPTTWPISATPPTSTRWWFSSWSPDETRLITTQEPYGAMRFVDAATGAFVPTAEPLPSNCTQPAWSPDGASIAYVSDSQWQGTDNTFGDISILPVTGPDTVGAPRLVHRATDLGASCDSYPTWTPDSQFLAFANGVNSRSDFANHGRPTAMGGLYTMRPDGTGVTRLDRAMGGADQRDSFQPRFSPFHQGGYYWLSFLSRRDYGNATTGTRGTGRQQIWVTAIRDDQIGTGVDPSSVGYWLPGQDTASRNISADWAPRACRPDGETCSVGSECCGGECVSGPGGVAVCMPPPPDRCRASGETCFTDADCCSGSGLSCFGNVCAEVPL